MSKSSGKQDGFKSGEQDGVKKVVAIENVTTMASIGGEYEAGRRGRKVQRNVVETKGNKLQRREIRASEQRQGE